MRIEYERVTEKETSKTMKKITERRFKNIIRSIEPYFRPETVDKIWNDFNKFKPQSCPTEKERVQLWISDAFPKELA